MSDLRPHLCLHTKMRDKYKDHWISISSFMLSEIEWQHLSLMFIERRVKEVAFQLTSSIPYLVCSFKSETIIPDSFEDERSQRRQSQLTQLWDVLSKIKLAFDRLFTRAVDINLILGFQLSRKLLGRSAPLKELAWSSFYVYFISSSRRSSILFENKKGCRLSWKFSSRRVASVLSFNDPLPQ